MVEPHQPPVGTTFMCNLPNGYDRLVLIDGNRIMAAGPCMPSIVYDEKAREWHPLDQMSSASA